MPRSSAKVGASAISAARRSGITSRARCENCKERCAVPRDQVDFEELARRAILDPEDDEGDDGDGSSAEARAPGKGTRPKARTRMAQLADPFVRVKERWFDG